MQLPFMADEFFAAFASYNDDVWPAQVLLYLLAAGLVAAAIRPRAGSGRVILVVLGALWLWSGVAYHVLHFAGINPAAYVFGAAFVAQGVLFWIEAARPAAFGVRPDVRGWLGGLLILYALAGYPLVARAVGQSYPAVPTFGAPCPLTIFTFGLLLWSDRGVRTRLLIVPLLWSAIGTSAAFAFGVWEDVPMPLAAVVATALLVAADRRAPSLAASAGGAPQPRRVGRSGSRR